MNTFGTKYRFTTFGESHGPAIGGVIDGMPPCVSIDLARVQSELDRRRPGQSSLTTSRNEPDRVRILSGIFEGKTTGTPIGFVIENTNQRSGDYSEMADKLRPNHADFTYMAKYGIRDYRGGGRSSARETACRVVAGAFARQYLEAQGIEIVAFAERIGAMLADVEYAKVTHDMVDTSAVRCPDATASAAMEAQIRSAQKAGDTLGGVVTCIVRGAPAGLGEPLYGKLSAMIASAMFSINACKGVEIGDGFKSAAQRGTRQIDPFAKAADGRIVTLANHSGGIQGGISNGSDIVVHVAFKPIASLMQDIETVTVDGEPTVLHPRGRHDVCVVPRAVPVVEAMTACVMLDALLLSR